MDDVMFTYHGTYRLMDGHAIVYELTGRVQAAGSQAVLLHRRPRTWRHPGYVSSVDLEAVSTLM